MLKPAPSRKIIYWVFLWTLLIAGILILLRLAPILSKPEYLLSDDFVRYWASGKLNLEGINPFDPEMIQQLQLELGDAIVWSDTTSITLTPPWVMPLLMPLGMFSYPTGRLAWLLVSVLILLFSSQLLWRTYTGNRRLRWLSILVVVIFAPTISVLEKGQITSVVLLGLAGFLFYSSVKRNDWLAGLSLALVSFKPQLILVFWLALIVWVIQQRRWLILFSTAIGVLSLILISMTFNSHIIQQYLEMLQSYGISDWANPTLGSYLRFFWFGTNQFWLQFLPAVFGAAWFLYYWHVHHHSWDWLREFPIILLVSLITSPYAWTYDQVILIPVVIQAAVLLTEDREHRRVIIFGILYLALNLLNLLLHMRLDDFWFIWFSPALLIWYLLLCRQDPSGAGYSRLSNQTAG